MPSYSYDNINIIKPKNDEKLMVDEKKQNKNMKNKFFRIEKKYVGENKRVFIIAELGINHGGNFKRCIKMINAAAKAGADSVKIQTNDVNES